MDAFSIIPVLALNYHVNYLRSDFGLRAGFSTTAMDFFQATGLIGTCNTIATILVNIRKCLKAREKIGALVSDASSSIENIKFLAPEICRFAQLRRRLRDFCIIAGKIIKIEDDLLNMQDSLSKMNQVYRFCSATETVAALESVCAKLALLEMEIRLMIPSLETNAQVSAILEASEMNPNTEESRRKQRMLNDAGKVFGTGVIASRLNNLLVRRAYPGLSWGRCSTKG